MVRSNFLTYLNYAKERTFLQINVTGNFYERLMCYFLALLFDSNNFVLAVSMIKSNFAAILSTKALGMRLCWI